MRNRIFFVLPLIFIFLSTWVLAADEDKESCPETGTSFDPLIEEAYECYQQFLEADESIANGMIVVKELFGTTMGKTEEEKEEIMAMADTSFINLVSEKETRQEFLNELSDDGTVVLDSLKPHMDAYRKELNGILASANELAKEIPGAIKRIPSELKGMNMMKIPAVKEALQTTLRWIEEVLYSAPIDDETIDFLIDIAKANTE